MHTLPETAGGHRSKEPYCRFVGAIRPPPGGGQTIEIEVDVQPPATPLLVRVYTPDEYDLESMVATLIVSVGPGH